MPVSVKPDFVQDEMVMLFFSPPLSSEQGEPFNATIVLEDHRNRLYELPNFTFRPTPSGQSPPPIQQLPPPKPGDTPVLHASWNGGSSVWGWATPFPDEDPVYVIRGTATMILDNIKEDVLITGVEIEGAETLGTFEKFTLEPGRVRSFGLIMHFRGKAPKGNDYYTVQLVFRDIRGNRYPIEPYKFHPLPIPERVEIERGRGENKA
jgi:hypothetical protein